MVIGHSPGGLLLLCHYDKTVVGAVSHIDQVRLERSGEVSLVEGLIFLPVSNMLSLVRSEEKTGYWVLFVKNGVTFGSIYAWKQMALTLGRSERPMDKGIDCGYAENNF